MSIIIFIIVLVVLILVHEIGHFLSAKKFGIRVDEFGIGFPPKLFGKKIGETTYSVNAIPFGGFVKIFGENPDEESSSGPDSKRSFVNKPKRVQALVLVAGVAFNILLAWLLFSVGFMSGMPTSISEGERDRVYNPELTILSVLPNSPAKSAGLKAGDKIVSIATKKETVDILNSENVSEFISLHKGEEIAVIYERGNEVVLSEVTPIDNIIINEPERGAIGISMGLVGILKLPPHLAIWEGGKMTANMLYAIVVAFGGLLMNIFMLNADLSQITGPVGIVGFVGDAASLGFIYLLSFTAFISLNLAIINLLPFPALDGGRLLFILIEAIKGSRINPKVTNTLNTIGFTLLILLMLAVTYSDIVKLF